MENVMKSARCLGMNNGQIDLRSRCAFGRPGGATQVLTKTAAARRRNCYSRNSLHRPYEIRNNYMLHVNIMCVQYSCIVQRRFTLSIHVGAAVEERIVHYLEASDALTTHGAYLVVHSNVMAHVKY